MAAVAASATGSTQRRFLKPGWPIYALFVGFPIWWLLGLGGFIWPILAFPMLLSLLRRERIYAPPGMLLWARVPRVDVGHGHRDRQHGQGAGLRVPELPVRVGDHPPALRLQLVARRAGDGEGPLGVSASSGSTSSSAASWVWCSRIFSFTSPVEAMLPHAILSNDFVKEMVHPAFAQVQEFLGFPTPRPSAPFVYTNDWGGCFGLLVPFVILAWQTGVRRRFKMILGVMAAASIIPVVLSMNRGLWLSLGLGLVYAALRLSLKGRERALIAFVAVTILLVGALFFTPLGTTLSERLATPHSNNRRVSLYEEAVRGAAESPLFGFGAPRPSKWNPNAPSVGTQGQLWLVLFSNGYPGMLLFLAWFLATLWWFRGSAEPFGFWMHVMLVIMFLQLAVYGLLPVQIHIVMLGIALAWRERLAGDPDADRDPGARATPCTAPRRWPDDRVRLIWRPRVRCLAPARVVARSPLARLRRVPDKHRAGGPATSPAGPSRGTPFPRFRARPCSPPRRSERAAHRFISSTTPCPCSVGPGSWLSGSSSDQAEAGHSRVSVSSCDQDLRSIPRWI